jgi:TFIIF-interacting CTD phosphatase-like protein
MSTEKKLGLNGKKNLLLLDLDGTLITSMTSDTPCIHNFIYGHGSVVFKVFNRPFLNVFLDNCFNLYNIGIWTASHKEYAKYISKKILGERFEDLSLFLYGRESLFNGVKSIYKLKSRSQHSSGVKLSDYNIVLLDNEEFNYNRLHSVKISTYTPSRTYLDSSLLDSLDHIKSKFDSLDSVDSL